MEAQREKETKGQVDSHHHYLEEQNTFPFSPKNLLDLLVNPRQFFSSQLALGKTPYILFVSWCYGMMEATDKIEIHLMKSDFFLPHSSPDPGILEIADSWGLFWGFVLILGAFNGLFLWWFGGWWFRVRVRLSGVSQPDKRLSRLVYVYSSFAYSGPSLALLLACTSKYSNYRETFDQAITYNVAPMFFYLLSLGTSYIGVRTLFPVSRWKARVWFLILPAVLFISVGIGGLIYGITEFQAVRTGEDLGPEYLDRLRQAEILEEDEELILFFSPMGLSAILEDGNILTDRRVISYETYGDRTYMARVLYSDIKRVMMVKEGSFLSGTLIEVTTFDGDSFFLQVTPYQSGDQRFLVEITNRLCGDDLQDAVITQDEGTSNSLLAASSIPDEHLFEAIISHFGGQTPTLEEVETVRVFSATGYNIRTLDGIHAFKNLEILFLNDNQISDLKPLAYVQTLRVLNLRNNRVKDLEPLSHLEDLQVLFLTNNQIDDIEPLARLTALYSLDLGNNYIEDISAASNLHSLEQFDLGYNELTDADLTVLSGLQELKRLRLAGNEHISNLEPLSTLVSLEWLDLSDNEISDLSPLRDLMNVEFLSIDDNRITDLTPLEEWTHLSILKAATNHIEDVSPLLRLSRNSSLEVILLTNNPLSENSREKNLPLIAERGITVLLE